MNGNELLNQFNGFRQKKLLKVGHCIKFDLSKSWRRLTIPLLANSDGSLSWAIWRRTFAADLNFIKLKPIDQIAGTFLRDRYSYHQIESSLFRLFRQISGRWKLPFEGNVTWFTNHGVLRIRNLDFQASDHLQYWMRIGFRHLRVLNSMMSLSILQRHFGSSSRAKLTRSIAILLSAFALVAGGFHMI